jgi:hypothetical protein
VNVDLEDKKCHVTEAKNANRLDSNLEALFNKLYGCISISSFSNVFNALL